MGTSGAGGAAAPAAIDLPDVNREIHPFDQVAAALDQVAYGLFQVEPAPEPDATFTPERPDDYFGINGGYGLAVRGGAHPFDSVVADVEPAAGLAIGQRTGGRSGELTGRWLFAPEGVAWRPGAEPPPTLWDPWRPHSLVLLDTALDLGRGNRLRGYGIGRLLPLTSRGRTRVLAGAVVDIAEATGRFAGLGGTMVFNGELRDLGYAGQVSVRLIDPEGRVRRDREVRATPRAADLEPGVTYLVMRGEKRSAAVRTEYGPPAGADVRLVTPAQMRSAEYRFDPSATGGPQASRVDRQVIGSLRATVTLDILAPPGTPDRPNGFTTLNVYTFTDADGREVGTITAEVELGRSFGLLLPSLPGQPAMRYGGYGRIVGGGGAFAGVEGALSVNSAIGVQPHALSMLNVLRILDPDHRFRSLAG